MTNKMKLFYWPEVEAMKDWAYGDVIVMAKDLDEALETIRTDESYKASDIYQELKGKKDEVRIYDKPKMISIMGSA